MRIRSLAFIVPALFTAACAARAGAPETLAPKAPAPFARCSGARCDFDLTIELAPGGAEARLLLEQCIHPAPGCDVNVGRLTAAGRAAAAAVRNDLSHAALARSYGCPGCSDGPAFSFVLRASDGAVTRHVYDAVYDDIVPEVLRPAHRLFAGSEHALAVCAPSEQVELIGPCVPRH